MTSMNSWGVWSLNHKLLARSHGVHRERGQNIQCTGPTFAPEADPIRHGELMTNMKPSLVVVGVEDRHQPTSAGFKGACKRSIKQANMQSSLGTCMDMSATREMQELPALLFERRI